VTDIDLRNDPPDDGLEPGQVLPALDPERSTQLLLAVTTSRGRRVRNGLATAWRYGAFVVAVIPLGLIIFFISPRTERTA